MRRWLLAASCLLFALPLSAQDLDADKLFGQKQYGAALEIYRGYPDQDPRAAQAHLRAAQCCALLGRSDEAFAYLGRYLDEVDDFSAVTYLGGDERLASLKSDPRWLGFIDRMVERWKSSNQHLLLKNEILRMTAEDQCLRFAASAVRAAHKDGSVVADRLAAADRAHTGRMKQLVAENGWPHREMVGLDGSHAAWLLVQHADHDREFQHHCLDLMRPLVQQGLVDRSDFAYLTDRVLVGEGKAQLYGTQFRTVGGKLEPSPCADPVRLDERRKSMGLESMEDYSRRMQSLP
jgi:tetratricopeptide (TPR) repeat protein